MTLPLIYALQTATPSEKRKIINIIKRHHNNPKKVQEVVEFVNNSGGIAYAEKKMEEYKEKAISFLSKYPNSPTKDSLLLLVDYVIHRSK